MWRLKYHGVVSRTFFPMSRNTDNANIFNILASQFKVKLSIYKIPNTISKKWHGEKAYRPIFNEDLADSIDLEYLVNDIYGHLKQVYRWISRDEL